MMTEEHICTVEWGSGSTRRSRMEVVENRGDDGKGAHVGICPSGRFEG